MTRHLLLASMNLPEEDWLVQPKLVYDDDCGFCTRSALYIADNSTVELVPFSNVPEDLLRQLPTDWRSCAHLATEATIYSCGEAMERGYELTGRPPAKLIPYLRRLPGYATVRELVYNWIADHRVFVSRLTRLWL